jgi:hypothetical protein
MMNCVTLARLLISQIHHLTGVVKVPLLSSVRSLPSVLYTFFKKTAFWVFHQSQQILKL